MLALDHPSVDALFAVTGTPLAERLLTTANNDAEAQLLRDIGVPVPGIEVLEAAE